ncbi:MAG: SAM-dependent methyltransferase [Flavobacteriaceae bacterium CG18_big_fil_WC_8_21_14_2_50_34_36]|nr:class I SAM-dependent methyltransferase [Bacteroidota bacterium]PIQ17963.1 MAG: SAM-dependent methyltransferase [Flavobacteriaceae bacterium CG18_big_fil_WC_8_21_14_2_50_34_36]PJC06865.1 MAG: SAM-dependent methyltransferase [Flavobacteriaceae bacterium CG_4_9_14_0_8_um_filter_34_30]
MKKFWNERYGKQEYIYGKTPNVFFEKQLQKLKPGKLLLPCEGEGRNAVFAASKGWTVRAFDTSEAGKIKAMKLASENNVDIDYLIDDATTVKYPQSSFEVIAFIYAHFPTNIRKQIHQKAIEWLKPGGKIILEAFNPKQLQNNSGGPKELAMLYTEEMLRNDFENLDIELLESKIIELNEGEHHKGKADIIQFVGTKN